MSKYTSQELECLKKDAKTIKKGKICIEVRESGKRHGQNGVDAFEAWCQNHERLDREIGEYPLPELQEQLPEADELTMFRRMCGFPALNLCTQEIYTRYETLECEGDNIGLWRYYKRKTVKKERPCLIYIHGGGWIAGSVYTVENQCKLIAQLADAVVFNLDYTLAPEAKFPTALNSCYEAVKYIRNHAKEYGIDSTRIIIAGDSAGGNYAAALALKARDEGEDLFYMQYLLYPLLCIEDSADRVEGYCWSIDAYDLPEQEKETVTAQISMGGDKTPFSKLAVMHYLKEKKDVYHPYVSPLLAETWNGLPKTVIATADFDGLRIQDEVYAEKLKEQGNDVEIIRYGGTFHAFFDRLGYVPQAEAVCIDIACRLKE